ncbi:MAG: isoprenylcysteine carboxylmethyltransferase family protein [Rhodoblastus sp.]|nr:MAG: isoprenylcysteine carboxylmethyltransferase family protein [Rhodoblastus sp.]
MKEQRDASSAFPWPPAIYGTAALLAWALGHVAPAQLTLPAGMRWAGWALVALAAAIAGAAEISFLRAGTATLPTSPTTAIVETGIFRFSRNPMYLAMTLALIGLGVALSQPWFWAAALIAARLVTRFAIEREEAYLTRKFGAAYLAYSARVRRWL